MKKKIVAVVLLAFMLVSLIMPFLANASNKHEPEIKEVPLVFVTAKPETQEVEILETKSLEQIAMDSFYDEMESLSDITDKREWFIKYKAITEKYADIVDPPESIYDCFTEEELDLLFKVVQAEIGDSDDFIQKVNIASVIFNRLKHERFPDVLAEILVYDQFSPISDGRYEEVDVTEDTILACEYAFIIEDTTDGCLFFDSNETLNYKHVFEDGAHNFYKYWKEN